MSSRLVLGDYVELVRGKTYKGSLVGAPGPALLGLGSIVPGGGFRHDFKTYGGECPPGLMLEPGDLYVSLKGATKDGEMIGSVARVPESVPSGRLTQDTVRLLFRDRDDGVERYIYWLLQTRDYRDYCAARATGSAVVALSRTDFLSYAVPPLTQRRVLVVEVLEKIDDKLESDRRAEDVTLELLDALSERAAVSIPLVPLTALASISRSSVNPAVLGDGLVDHYSLPAFDAGARAEVVPASSIMSNKINVGGRSVLVSRLNPRIERTWWVSPRDSVPALASTEFACLTARDDEDLAAVWLAVRTPYFRQELTHRVTGTSGSHQRVRPDDLLAIEVPDFRKLPAHLARHALRLLESVDHLRREMTDLAALRSLLLPGLQSGRDRTVSDTETLRSTNELEHA